MENTILQQLRNREISAKEAYEDLYPKVKFQKPRRAHFVKLRIIIPNEKGVTRFLKILFLLPAPLFMVKLGLRFVKFDSDGDMPLSKSEIIKMISYKGIIVDVKTHSGEKVIIKTI